MRWQIILLVMILVLHLTAGNILVRPLDEAKRSRNVRVLNLAGTASKTAEGAVVCISYD